jgi:DNA-binding LacI/PurR family transcriptional regulator
MSQKCVLDKAIVFHYCRKTIASPIFPELLMTATLAKIADAAGVSVATVSRALTDSGHPVKDETRQRIVSLAEEMGYEPNLIARGLRKQQTHTVGVIVDKLSSPFAAMNVQGLQDRLKEAGYSISIVNANREQEIAIEAIKEFYRRRADGIVLLNSWLHPFNDAFLTSLHRSPFVLVNRIIEDVRSKCVIPDDRLGACMAVDHLAELGHRRIGYIDGLTDWIEAQNRLAGYQDLIHERNLDADDGLIQQGDWGVDSGYEATKRLLALKTPPTAIFASNDLMALGAMYAIQDAGLRVATDMAIVGYDDRDLAGWVRPSLTTVRMPSYEMGQAAATLLLNQIAENDEPLDATRVLGQLVVRNSCGAPSTGLNNLQA